MFVLGKKKNTTWPLKWSGSWVPVTVHGFLIIPHGMHTCRPNPADSGIQFPFICCHYIHRKILIYNLSLL